jgi:hypothetical protein
MPHTVTISDESYEYLQQQTQLGAEGVGVLLDSIIADDRDRWQHACQNQEPTYEL